MIRNSTAENGCFIVLFLLRFVRGTVPKIEAAAKLDWCKTPKERQALLPPCRSFELSIWPDPGLTRNTRRCCYRCSVPGLAGFTKQALCGARDLITNGPFSVCRLEMTRGTRLNLDYFIPES